MFTVYDHPSDYPDSYVVREWSIRPDGPVPLDIVGACSTLEEARAIAGADGRFRLPAYAEDDPAILETWL